MRDLLGRLNITNFDEVHLTTTMAKTYSLKRQDTIFSGLKQQYGEEILKLVDNAPKRNKGAVFMVVGIKVCVDAEISSQNSKERQASGRGTAPVNEALVAQGVPPVVDLDLEAEVSAGDKGTSDGSQIAKGPRIFAVQYRVIKKKSDWGRKNKAKTSDVNIEDTLIPKSNSMFGKQKAEEESAGEGAEEGWEKWFAAEEDDEDNGNEGDSDDEKETPDPVQLGDWQHTLVLGQVGGSEVIMTQL
jgi:hypothetical protein